MSLPLGKYTFQIRESNGRKEIFDVCRKIYVVLTPEEFVRQHLLHYLIIDKNYPLGFTQTEYALLVNDTPKRSDIINKLMRLIIDCVLAQTSFLSLSLESNATFIL